MQSQQLESILHRNASSQWGRRYRFDAIRSYADYVREVPVSAYCDLSPWLERVTAGESGVLSSDRVVAFEETGGSGDGRKLVPYTGEGLTAFRRGLLPWLDDLFQSHPDLAGGCFYWAISPACRVSRETAGGVKIGLPGDAAYFGEELQQPVLEALAVPPVIGKITDFETWRELTLFHLLANENLALISVWSPTFLTELLRFAVEHAARFAHCVERGLPRSGVRLPLRDCIPPVQGNARRADMIRAALGRAQPDYAQIWPGLRVISCWDQASARPQADRLRQLFPGVVVQGKGLLATEGLITIPLSGYAFPVLAIESGFWEFVDPGGRACMAHEVIADCEYSLVITTHSGLYRYAIGDRVKIRGFADDTPLLEFVGRGDLTSDLCGEKLTEDLVAKVLAPLQLQFAMLSPVQQDRRYVLILDAQEVADESRFEAEQRVDQALKANPQYSYARQIGQLAGIHAVRCDRPLEKWIARGLARGQRLADIKLQALVTDPDWSTIAG